MQSDRLYLFGSFVSWGHRTGIILTFFALLLKLLLRPPQKSLGGDHRPQKCKSTLAQASDGTVGLFVHLSQERVLSQRPDCDMIPGYKEAPLDAEEQYLFKGTPSAKCGSLLLRPDPRTWRFRLGPAAHGDCVQLCLLCSCKTGNSELHR